VKDGTTIDGEHWGEVRPAREVQLSDRVGLSVADRDQHAARVDAVAGAEFLDDRLRREE
jgi:hypothetical protein